MPVYEFSVVQYCCSNVTCYISLLCLLNNSTRTHKQCVLHTSTWKQCFGCCVCFNTIELNMQWRERTRQKRKERKIHTHFLLSMYLSTCDTVRTEEKKRSNYWKQIHRQQKMCVCIFRSILFSRVCSLYCIFVSIGLKQTQQPKHAISFFYADLCVCECVCIAFKSSVKQRH